jgi:hypothetical protein
MNEFCVKCSEKESEMELLRKRHYDEVQCMKAKIDKVVNENEALIMDVAFYGGNMINLSCNDK